jgi:C-terminal processing protease CtpA/Prc
MKAQAPYTGVVWDLRGNTGGCQEWGAVLGGNSGTVMGTSEGAYAKCYARKVGSNPVAFDRTAVEYSLPFQAFVDKPLIPMAVPAGAKQVVLTDGLSVSAADWAAYAAKKAGIKVVGHAAAGMFGYQTGASFTSVHYESLSNAYPYTFSSIAGSNCEDSAGPMEGKTYIDTVVDFKPSDLAAGIDTQLEAAAAIVAP